MQRSSFYLFISTQQLITFRFLTNFDFPSEVIHIHCIILRCNFWIRVLCYSLACVVSSWVKLWLVRCWCNVCLWFETHKLLLILNIFLRMSWHFVSCLLQINLQKTYGFLPGCYQQWVNVWGSTVCFLRINLFQTSPVHWIILLDAPLLLSELYFFNVISLVST